jgi:dihydroflavonol-4-reductase
LSESGRTRRSTRRAAEPPPPPAPRRIVVTGGAGLVGRAIVRALRERGDTVIALVRDPRRAAFLAELGTELVESNLSDVRELTETLRGADALIHAAGSYRIGIPKSDRGAMWDANVGTTTRLLDAAEAAGTPRIVYVSTGNVYGNTRGMTVDETYRRNLDEGFLSWYDETKYGAHEVAEQRIAGGAPVVIVLPSQVYGPGDRSQFGEQLRMAHAGKLGYLALGETGVCLIHADDLAAGIVAAADRGTAGQSYNLGGPKTTLGEAVEIAARIGGRKPPALRIPTGLLRAMAPLGALSGQPNLPELISASAGVTYWFGSEKAAAELEFAARDIETGLRDTFGTGSRTGADAGSGALDIPDVPAG